MKTIQIGLHALVFAAVAFVASASAQSTAFTYNGRLNDAGSPANGNYDIQFTLKDALSAGSTVGTPQVIAPVAVSGGLFAVTLDFGGTAFNGSDRWLEIGVRPNGSADAYTILTPRQKMSPVPYSIRAAEAAAVTGSVAASQLTGTVALARLPSEVSLSNGTNSWSGSNTFGGSFGVNLGSTSNSISLTAGSPGGGAGGNITLLGGTGANAIGGQLTLQAGDTSNWAGAGATSDTYVRGGTMQGTASYAQVRAGGGKAISGGVNEAHGGVLELSGGAAVGTNRNGGHVIIKGGAATGTGTPGRVGIGTNSPATALDVSGTVTATAFAGDGSALTSVTVAAGNVTGVLGAGQIPDLDGDKITTGTVALARLPSGLSQVSGSNSWSGSNSFAGSFGVNLGSNGNSINLTAGNPGGTTQGGNITLLGGTGSNAIGGLLTLQAGDTSNWAGAGASSDSYLRGGTMQGTASYAQVRAGGGKAISGGVNEAHGGVLELSGGAGVGTNRDGGHVIIKGGAATGSGTAGRVGIGTNTPATALDVSGTVTATAFAGDGSALTALAAANVTGVLAEARIPDLDGGKITTGTVALARLPSGLAQLSATNSWSGSNSFAGSFGVNLGANGNSISLTAGSPGGGAGGNITLLGGTGANAVGGQLTLQAGDTSNWAGAGATSDTYVRGGTMTGTVSYAQVRVGGGKAISGGVNEAHGGVLELKGGPAVGTNRNGGNVIITPGAETGSGTPGRVGIGTASPSETLHVVGNILATGTITPSSDRNVKKNFEAVAGEEVLSGVLAMPIQRWTYKHEDEAIHHLGPMAQDFRAAFGLGANDVTIATVDADGVALAAIQGLNQKLERQLKQRDEELQQQSREIDDLKKELQQLRSLITASASQEQGGVK